MSDSEKAPAPPVTEKEPSSKRVKKPAFQMTEKKGDLFSTEVNNFAQCISSDLAMNKGIVVEFNKRYGGRENIRQKLRMMELKVGDVGVVSHHGSTLFNLVTKPTWRGSPTLATFRRSLAELARQCQQRGVRELAMPRIGCGLDGLEWNSVRGLIEEAFVDSDVHVHVYSP